MRLTPDLKHANARYGRESGVVSLLAGVFIVAILLVFDLRSGVGSRQVVGMTAIKYLVFFPMLVVWANALQHFWWSRCCGPMPLVATITLGGCWLIDEYFSTLVTSWGNALAWKSSQVSLFNIKEIILTLLRTVSFWILLVAFKRNAFKVATQACLNDGTGDRS